MLTMRSARCSRSSSSASSRAERSSGLAADLGDLADRVVRERAVLDERRLAGRAAARERAHARLQLLERERLGEIVVGAEVEAAHAVLDAVLRGEDQHRQFAAPAAQALQHFEPAHLRQAEVEDQQVEFEARDRAIGFGAGRHAVHRVARIAQAAQQTVGQNRVVFGDQNPHPARPLVRGRRCRRPLPRAGNRDSSLAKCRRARTCATIRYNRRLARCR